MSKRLVIWIVVTLAGIGCAITVCLLQPGEPQFGGRRLSEWLANLDRQHNRRSQIERAEKAVRCIGPNALPFLLRMLQTSDSAFKRKGIEMARKQSVIAFQFPDENQRLNWALAGFHALGSEAESAVPTLIAWIEAKGVTTDTRTRCRALAAIREIGPPASNAIPALLAALNDKEKWVRSNAAIALGAVGQRPAVVVPALVASLNDPDPVVRGFSVAALYHFGDQAKPAVAALRNARDDSDVNVRGLVAAALKKIELATEETVEDPQFLLNVFPK